MYLRNHSRRLRGGELQGRGKKRRVSITLASSPTACTEGRTDMTGTVAISWTALWATRAVLDAARALRVHTVWRAALCPCRHRHYTLRVWAFSGGRRQAERYANRPPPPAHRPRRRIVLVLPLCVQHLFLRALLLPLSRLTHHLSPLSPDYS